MSNPSTLHGVPAQQSKSGVRSHKMVVLTIKNGVKHAVDRLLTFAEVLMMLVHVVEVLCESPRRPTDLLAGGDDTWPA